MKVGLFRETDGACDLYRAVQPLMIAAKKKEVEVSELWTANLLYDVANRTDSFWKGMNSDIYLLQRVAGQSLIRKIKEFVSECKLKTKIVLDYDDNVFEVSPLSNHYVDYGIKECKIVLNGKVMHEWKDGVNIDLKLNQGRLDQVKKTLEEADLITTTTDILADVYRQYNQSIRILPNCIDLTQWRKLPIKRSNPDEIRLCWAGGHSHYEDLMLIRDPLIEIAKKYPNLKIVMVGYMPQSMEKTFAPGQVEYHDWVETPAHPYHLAALDIDIAMIPLKDTSFNRCKSSIKWLEFSALNIPSVVSYLPPYKEMADLDNGENGVFIEENNKQNWIAGLEFLIHSSDLRKEIGQKARKTVENHYDANKRYREWILAYEEVLSGDPVESCVG